MFKQRNSFRGNSYSGGGGGRGFGGGGRRFGQRGGFRGGGGGRRFSAPKSTLGRDPSIFIKKATFDENVPTYTSTTSFETLPISDALKANIAKKHYTTPTPIQDQAIMPILEGKDLIGLASTGTGKTAAFLIPIIEHMLKDRNKKALIIAPSRELAAQINEEFRIFAAGLNLYSALVIGGSNFNRQVQEVRRDPNIVIATPGRLKDLIQRNILYLEDFSTFVLDEVDLMVDIGFIHDIKFFISLLPQKRQSLFFSATIPDKIIGIINSFVVSPVRVSVKKQETSENVEQDIVRVISKDQKIEQLHQLLIKDGFDKVMIFGRTKHGVERLSRDLADRGFRVGAIHGNKKQGQRQRTLQSFKQNNIQVLLATDVAARGLDINNVTHVINYDLPQTYEDYIHRIGRTGRADKKGVALTFIE